VEADLERTVLVGGGAPDLLRAVPIHPPGKVDVEGAGPARPVRASHRQTMRAVDELAAPAQPPVPVERCDVRPGTSLALSRRQAPQHFWRTAADLQVHLSVASVGPPPPATGWLASKPKRATLRRPLASSA
jgi:hypothetical protein